MVKPRRSDHLSWVAKKRTACKNVLTLKFGRCLPLKPGLKLRMVERLRLGL